MKPFTKPWWDKPAAAINNASQDRASNRQAELTKPPGSLGKLENIAIKFAGWQGLEIPQLENISICVFAADHGVVAEGVSAFPQVVTAEMIRNFSRGGAAISVIADELNASFAVVNVGTVDALEPLPRVIDARVASGSANFCHQPAMTWEQLEESLRVGAAEINPSSELFIGGEMGIGNTTSAAAITSALLDLSAATTVGRGTGIDDRTLIHKQKIVAAAVTLHAPACNAPLAVLKHLGGLEIAALVGAYIAAAQQSVPILVDGYISSVAALLACRINETVRDWMIFAHRSAEPGHRHVLDALQAEPLLDLNMHLGEGSGAGIAVAPIRSALRLHAHMATFAEAAVTGKRGEDDS